MTLVNSVPTPPDNTPSTPGFAVVPNWMIRDTSVSIYAIAVYAALASHSGLGGIHPSHETLAAEARCSARKVRDALDELRGLGVVASQRRQSRAGRTSNSYTLHPNGDAVPAHGAVTLPEVTAPGDAGNGTTCRQVTAPRAEEEEPLEEEPVKKNPYRAPRGTRIDKSGFTVTPELVKWAAEHVPSVDGRTETEKFRNHFEAKAGREAVKIDWPKTWKNWMLNAHERKVERGWKPTAAPLQTIEQLQARREALQRGE